MAGDPRDGAQVRTARGARPGGGVAAATVRREALIHHDSGAVRNRRDAALVIGEQVVASIRAVFSRMIAALPTAFK